MFFLLRSAVCIGIVVAALPDHGATGRGETVVASLGAAAAGGAAQFCRAAPGHCLAALSDGIQATGAGASRVGRIWTRPSRDTLSMADRRPAWSGQEASATD